MDIPITIEEDTPERVYQAGDNKNTSIHEGQRKLLMTEVQFLTNMYDPDIHLDPVVLYVGSSPGYHINLLMQLFPQFEYYLVDPAPSKVNELAHYSKQFFTQELAQYYKNLFKDRDVFFISDIRSSYPTGINRATKDEELKIHNATELLIHREMEMQREWVEILDPVACHLKFRLPWYTYTMTEDKARSIGVRGEYLQQRRMWEYLDGTIYIQPWATQFGTETRLVASRPYRIKDYDCIKYDQQLFYINMSRQDDTFDNPYYDPSFQPELVNDYDSCLEALIWEQYIQTRPDLDLDLETAVTQLARLTSDFLYMQYTGKGTSVRSLWSMRQSGMYDTAAMGRYPPAILDKLHSLANQQRYRLFTVPVEQLIPDNALIDTYLYPSNEPTKKVTKAIRPTKREYIELSPNPTSSSSSSSSSSSISRTRDIRPIPSSSSSSSSSSISRTRDIRPIPSSSSSSSSISRTRDIRPIPIPSSSSSSSSRTRDVGRDVETEFVPSAKRNLRSDGGVISTRYSDNQNKGVISTRYSSERAIETLTKPPRTRSKTPIVAFGTEDKDEDEDVPISFPFRKPDDSGVISTRTPDIITMAPKRSTEIPRRSTESSRQPTEIPRRSTESSRRLESFDSSDDQGVVFAKTVVLPKRASESRRRGVEKSGRQ